MAALVGAALGLAGAEMQTILNNPLASPFTLGVSSAAAFGASLAIVLNLGLPGVPAGWLIAGNAFLFAALAALALDAAARWAGMNTQGVVLFGIAMVFSFNALVSLVHSSPAPRRCKTSCSGPWAACRAPAGRRPARWPRPWHWPCRWPCVSPGS